MCFGQNVSTIHYWFDGNSDMAYMESVSSSDIVFSYDVSGMSSGMHTLYYRLKDNLGKWSAVFAHHFFIRKTIEDRNVVALEYWFDKEIQIVERNKVNISESDASFEIKVYNLSTGEHTMYYRLLDNKGHYSAVKTFVFEHNNPYEPMMILPYDAFELNEMQRESNPDIMAYPTSLQDKVPQVDCELSE